MKKFIVTMIAIVMALSLVACGKSDPAPADQTNTPVATSTATELYIKTDKSGNVTVVDKDGKVADGYTVDKDGNVLDKDGKIAVAADKVVAYVEPAKAEDKTTKAEDKKTDKAEPITEQKTDSKSADTPSSSSGNSSASSGSGSSSSSGSQPSKPTHTHSYSSKTVAPTCSSDGYTVHTCSCGDSYTDSYKDALGHAWEAQYRNVTVDDYETVARNRCSVCDSDVTELLASGADMKQHRKETGCSSFGYYGTYEQVPVGSHTEQELTGYTCTRCGATK